MVSNRGRKSVRKQYETFVDDPERLPLGKEIDIEIRSLEPGKHKYEIRTVRAVLARDAAELKGADDLKLRLGLGEPVEGSWGIKIVNHLPLEKAD